MFNVQETGETLRHLRVVQAASAQTPLDILTNRPPRSGELARRNRLVLLDDAAGVRECQARE